MDRDELQVTYDPKQHTPESLVEVVRQQGFAGTIIPEVPPAAPSDGKEK